MLDVSATSDRELPLYVAEMLHRVKNEYAIAIALASVTASRSSSQETKGALEQVIECLTRFAKTHRLLSPPAFEAVTDLGEYLTQLCEIKVETELGPRGMSLNLAIPHLLTLDNARCWKVGLVVAELITNAARHGASSGPAEIFVSVALNAGQVECRVCNSGPVMSTFRPGLGTCLVDALAVELDGRIERRFGENGAMITLSFPAQSYQPSEPQKIRFIR
jgi:two-component sensor histidine kinase